MLDGFKKFILRGNVVDMAVGVVIGAAFGGVIAGLTKAFITPLIAVIVGKPDYSSLNFYRPWHRIPRRRFRQRRRLLHSDRRGCVLLRGSSRECPRRAHESRREAARSHH